jgi:hypothetical protein
MTDNTLKHLSPATLAQLVAEILTNHADVDEIGVDFHTEDAKAAYDTICETGASLTNDEVFNDLIDIALDEAAR